MTDASALVRSERGAGLETAFTLAAGGLLLWGRAWLVAPGASRVVGLGFVYALVLAVSLVPGVAESDRLVTTPAVAALGALAVVLVWAAPWQLRIPNATGMSAAGLGIAAAIAEEALFRRLLYGRVEAVAGAAVAILASALAFALVHVPLYGTAAFWVDLGAGFLLSWQRWASGSWTASAVTHSVANVLAAIS